MTPRTRLSRLLASLTRDIEKTETDQPGGRSMWVRGAHEQAVKDRRRVRTMVKQMGKGDSR